MLTTEVVSSLTKLIMNSDSKSMRRIIIKDITLKHNALVRYHKGNKAKRNTSRCSSSSNSNSSSSNRSASNLILLHWWMQYPMRHYPLRTP